MAAIVAGAPEAGSLFARAADLLDGTDPRTLARDAPQRATMNRVGQVLCCTHALAAWTLIAPKIPPGTIIAGYSIGDLAAWGCAGRLAPADVLELALARAELMDAYAGPDGGLAGIRGLGREQVGRLIGPRGLELAIVNGPDNVVVGGDRAALAELCEAAIANGAERAVVLDVRIPSHTSVLRPAACRFRERLDRVPLLDPPTSAPRLLSGLDGAPVGAGVEGLDKLARQIATTIDWAACLRTCRALKVTKLLELGPGHALSTIAKWSLVDVDVHRLEDFRTIAGLRSWIVRP
nr:acyltransferase domain-containing protein [Azospirillum argentinense]